MIFYLAALQTLNPSLREAAAIEGPRAGTSCAACSGRC